MKTLLAIGLGILLLIHPHVLAAATPEEQVRQTVDQVQSILNDPELRGVSKTDERRQKLRDAIYTAFDFTEMAKRSLGSHWRQLSRERQQEFVKLFTNLVEEAYAETIDSDSTVTVQYLKERRDNDKYAEVNTKIIDAKGREFFVDYRLHRVNGDWKVYDAVIANVSLVNNYRSQFNRLLAKSSLEDLLQRMREKQFKAPETRTKLSPR